MVWALIKVQHKLQTFFLLNAADLSQIEVHV